VSLKGDTRSRDTCCSPFSSVTGRRHGRQLAIDASAPAGGSQDSVRFESPLPTLRLMCNPLIRRGFRAEDIALLLLRVFEASRQSQTPLLGVIVTTSMQR
jgi:hypothetical protein